MEYFPTKVLLATDGSEDAALTAHAAADISKLPGSELHVVHVLPRSPRHAYPGVTPQVYA
jgi:nucleotide-binding universal stress UspA family protein